MIRTLYVEKRQGFDIEAKALLEDFKTNLGINIIKNVRLLNKYSFNEVEKEVYEKAKAIIFSEPMVDKVYEEQFPILEGEAVFAVEYLPGQYDQRADSAEQCFQILTSGEKLEIKSSKVVCLSGDISKDELTKIKQYYINPVDSREVDPLSKELFSSYEIPSEVEDIDNFTSLNDEGLSDLHKELGLAMTVEDLKLIKAYFLEEKRNPTITEIKVIDTYWSDHCRHTTFLTSIENVKIEDSIYSSPIVKSFNRYKEAREVLYKNKEKDMTLMDIAVIAMKELKSKGMLEDLDISDEINACSIRVKVETEKGTEDYLVMFKNETHNHPTEIEPFGGAATCLGGAIRDPLSGRTYVYQAMRVTGSGNPTVPIGETLKGKLPQRKITLGAAHGYSSYGNQIGLATGQVNEIYDPGYVAKRMEIGAVIAAAPLKNVRREEPVEGDIIVLLGGRTGRDGCGGATGSSKEHTVESIEQCGAEVQKGNAPTERKLQRLFRNPKVSTMIKRCNDFGAGGVSVAIGELCRGLDINLDLVPKKYEGLDGTELAISESQERMAVVIAKEDGEKFVELALEENLEATIVAEVTELERMRMFWNGKKIVDLSRAFLDTNGAKQRTSAILKAPKAEENIYKNQGAEDLKKLWFETMEDLNVASQKGLVERFDGTIGAGTVLMPFGGKYQLTPAEGMAARIPTLEGEAEEATIMTFGFNAKLSKWSPYHSAYNAVVESVSKIVATGGKSKKVWLTFQEYFEKLGKNPERWGKPLAALLGAYQAQIDLGIAAIGGKDSMSGSFGDMDVPPTLVSFAVAVEKAKNIISPEFKKVRSQVVYVSTSRDESELVNIEEFKKNVEVIERLIEEKKVISAYSLKNGGICEGISKMCFGNKIGVRLSALSKEELFSLSYGSFILEVSEGLEVDKEFQGASYKKIGETKAEPSIEVLDHCFAIDDIIASWEGKLSKVFKIKTEDKNEKVQSILFENPYKKTVAIKTAKPRVFIPVFPGTNCEYDCAKAFEKEGAVVKQLVLKNLTKESLLDSLLEMEKAIKNSEIIMLPGGFSAGDEPDGSAKFIATVFRNERISTAVMELLKNRDGLMLGICNGFQALVKLGLLPYGEIVNMEEDMATLTFNTIGRHMSSIINTKVVSTLSPWFNEVSLGDIHAIPISHGEGRFVAPEGLLKELQAKGQIATQYVDFNGEATLNMPYNPNGSMLAIEGITSPDGRILGKMGHSERIGNNLYKNIPGDFDQKLFKSGVNYFK